MRSRPLPFLLITLLAHLALAGVSCSDSNPESSSESKREVDAKETPKGDASSEKPVQSPDSTANLSKMALAGTFAVATVYPDRLASRLSSELLALGAADNTRAVQYKTDLRDAIGAFIELGEPGDMAAKGMDATRPITIFLIVGGVELDSAFNEAFNNLAGIDQLENIVVAAGNAKTQEESEQNATTYNAFRTRFVGLGFGIRIVVPATDPGLTLNSLSELLRDRGFAKMGATKGCDETFDSSRGVRVLADKREDVVVLDTAFFPWLADDSIAHLEASKLLLEANKETNSPLKVPSSEDGLAHMSFNSAALAKVFYLAGLTKGLAGADVLLSLPVGVGRDAPGNQLLLDLKTLRFASAMVDSIFRTGALETVYLDVLATEKGTLRTTAAFKYRVPSLAGFGTGRGLDTAGNFFTLDVTPLAVSSEGPWGEAELGANEFIKASSLADAADARMFPTWLEHPAFYGSWLHPFPSALWKERGRIDLGVVPGDLERLQWVVSGTASDSALVAFSVKTPAATFKHLLACGFEQKPASETCADETVVMATTTASGFYGQGIQYHLSERDGGVLLIVGTNAETVEALAGKDIIARPSAIAIKVDTTQSDLGTLPEAMKNSVLGVTGWMGGLSLDATAAEDRLIWDLSMDSPYAISILTGSVLGFGPALPNLNSMFEFLGAATQTQAYVAPKPVKKVGDKVDDGPKVPPGKEGIQAVFASKKDQVEKCYRRVMQKFGDQPGAIVVAVTIAPSGSVKRVSVDTDQVGHGMSICLEQKVKSWRFAPQADEVSVQKKWELK